MSNIAVTAWRQRGNIYLWRFKGESRNFPGLHCAVEEDGRRSILELLALMLESTYTERRSIRITPPPANITRIPGSESRWAAPSTWKIESSPAAPENHWLWSGDLAAPTLTLGRGKLMRLHGAFDTLAEYGDFCVHADDQKLHGFVFEKMAVWFWKLE